jgi:hypothetical protein
MTNEEFLLKMQSWQRRLLRERKAIRLTITAFEDGIVMATVWDQETVLTEAAYPEENCLKSCNEDNARNIDRFITNCLNND